MRVVVVGTSGSGKTTLAKALAAQLALPYIELDALNWQPGWRDLSRNDPDEFVRRVTLTVAADTWVVDGNYGLVRDLVWRRATHPVWLDYERPVVMRRVIRRSLARAALRTEMWAATESDGCTCCGRAIRSVGPGTPGTGAAENMRSASGGAIMPISWFCACAGRVMRKSCSVSSCEAPTRQS